MKPHIRINRDDPTSWVCFSLPWGGYVGSGKTPAAAYAAWSMGIRRYKPRA